MGQYNLVADPQSLDPGAVQGWIDQIQGAPNASNFLSTSGPDKTIVVSDNPARLNDGNVKLMQDKVFARDNVRITDRKKLFKEFNGFAQDGGRLVVINPDNPAGKDPANILAHEIGHSKWPGLGSGEPHQPLFYRLLRDNLNDLGLPVDRQKDLNGFSNDVLDKTPVPGGDSLKYNSGQPKPKPKPKEGTRKTAKPKVVSLTPSVNLTPMGAAKVPVPYPVVGHFEESQKTTPTVRFTSNQSFTMASYIPVVHGDAPGSAGGVKSGTVSKKAEPIEHSEKVRAEKFKVVRHDDLFWMNDRNTTGRAVFNPTGTA